MQRHLGLGLGLLFALGTAPACEVDLNAPVRDADRRVQRAEAPAEPSPFAVRADTAVRESDIEAMQALLGEGMSPDIELHSGIRPLLLAAWAGEVELVRLLLSAGAVVDMRNSNGETPLIVCSNTDRADAIAALLLEHGADPGLRDRFGIAAVWHAAARGRVGAVRALLDRGVDVEVAVLPGQDGAGETPLLQATAHGHLEIAELLLGAGALVDATSERGATPLAAAASSGHAALAKRLIEAGASTDINVEGGSLLTLAAWSNDHETFATIAAATGDAWLAATAQESFYPASHMTDKRSAEALLEAGARIDALDSSGLNALCASAARGDLDTVRWLIRRGADPRRRCELGNTALGLAAFGGHVDVVAELLAAGADIENLTDMRGTPLRGAADQGHLEVVRLLLEAGADPRVLDDYGKLAIDYARSNGHTAVIELLGSASAPVAPPASPAM